MDLYLMSPPPRGWALKARANFRSQNAAAVDPAIARREWLSLARALEERGGIVAVLPPPDDALTGMTYAAECGQVLARRGRRPLFLLPRMISAHRRAEREHWAPFARELGMEVVDPGEGIWEAQGDVAELDGATLLFHGGRTDEAGMNAAARHFEGELIRVKIHQPAFHGNMAALPLPAIHRMLVCPAVIAPESMAALSRRFPGQLLEVSEAEIRSYATNGLPVGEALLAPSCLPDRVRALVEAAGMKVISLPMGELCEKGGGASRCLVSRATLPDGAIAVPERHRLPAIAKELEA